MVRDLLNGRFENTAFCVFDPQGKKRLSRTGRGPAMGLSRRSGSDASIIERMNRIASDYVAKGQGDNAFLQDFNTFRQSLNVASADQRLLVFVAGDETQRDQVNIKLKQVFADDKIVGKFHLNFVNEELDEDWTKKVLGEKSDSGILIIRAGEFGISGTVMNQLPLTASANEVKSALLKANSEFATLEDRKDYRQHVSAGRRQGVHFENEIPYGEDRDGDGKIDRRRQSRRR